MNVVFNLWRPPQPPQPVRDSEATVRYFLFIDGDYCIMVSMLVAM